MSAVCSLCPRMCSVDRSRETGFCGMGDTLKIARAGLHLWEEPCISGENGSGTVFFSGCNLGCVFCQNYDISHRRVGKDITPERLYEIFYELKEKGAHNINLVTADHFTSQLVPVLKRVKSEGFPLPIVFNTSSYLRPVAIKMLEGLVDIYIADLKFSTPSLAKRYLRAENYPDISRAAVKLMSEQTGIPVIENGIMKSGVIIRVLVIPHNVIDAKLTLSYICKTFGDNVILSLMSQYTPIPEAPFPELKKPLTDAEYKSVVDYAVRLGFTNAYIQDGSSVGEGFIPDFNFEGV